MPQLRHFWGFKKIYKSIESAFRELNYYYAPIVTAKLKQRGQSSLPESSDAELSAEDDFLDSFLIAANKYASTQQKPESDEIRWEYILILFFFKLLKKRLKIWNSGEKIANVYICIFMSLFSTKTKKNAYNFTCRIWFTIKYSTNMSNLKI